MARTAIKTAVGTAMHPHLLVPDTKFNDDGVWKVKLILEAVDAAREKARIDALVEEAFADEVTKLPEAKQLKATRYYPYEEEFVDGKETGRIILTAKQNARIKLKEPDPRTGLGYKEIKIGVYDGNNKEMHGVDIWSGSKLRLIINPRPVVIKVGDPVRIGVQLSLYQVQVLDLKTGGQRGSGFDAVEGSYSHGDDSDYQPEVSHGEEPKAPDQQGDY